MILIYRSAVTGRRLAFRSNEVARVDLTPEKRFELLTHAGCRYPVTGAVPERSIPEGDQSNV